MARQQFNAAPKYIVRNEIRFPRPGRPLTGPGSNDEMVLLPSDEPQEVPAPPEGLAAYLLATEGRPADIVLYVDGAPAPVVVPDPVPAPEAPAA